MQKFPHKIFVLLLLFSIHSFLLEAQNSSSLIVTLKDHTDQVHSVAFSPDGKKIISGSKDETIKIWDFKTLNVLTSLKRHYATIYALEYSEDGKYFFSGGDKSINMWDSSGIYIRTLSGHTTSVWSIGISKDNSYLVSGSFDNNFRLWDIAEEKTIHIFDNNRKSVLAVAFSKANNLIASGSQDGSVDPMRRLLA